MYSKELERAIKQASKETFPISFGMNGDDYQAFASAINQGIDAHLEAVEFTISEDQRGRRVFNIHPQTLHVLVRRLLTVDGCPDESILHDIETCLDCMESYHAQGLGLSICEILGVEV